MRLPDEPAKSLGSPQLLDQAKQLVAQYRELPLVTIADIMKISTQKSSDVHQMYNRWSTHPARQAPAIDVFIGDIYSGLQVQTWSYRDRIYAHKHLIILSGLYGAVHACDGIMPYRLEMAYPLPKGGSLYGFWGDQIASVIPSDTTFIVNLSAVEYTKAVLPYVDKPVVAPKFLTISPKTGDPTFVTVHAKIARGAFARWLIQNKIEKMNKLPEFNELGYVYDPATSTPEQPVFICKQFEGLGLSVRLTT